MEYPEFQRKIAQIKEMGYVQSHRKGDTGIGKTLEDLLGLKENNISGPDFTKHELKSARKNTSSMLTLFTKAPKPKCVNTVLRETYGYPVGEDEVHTKSRQVTLSGQVVKNPKFSGDKELHSTFDAVKPNNLGFKLGVGAERVILENTKGIEAYWDRALLKESFEKKYHKLAYVLAENKKEDGKELFWYDEAYLLDGFGFDTFSVLVKEGVVKADIRLGHYESGPKFGKRHDHGTGFRVLPKYLPKCFSKIDRIL